MADFGSLLNQFTHDVKSKCQIPVGEASSITDGQERWLDQGSPTSRKRRRQTDANDFPATKHILLVCPAEVETGGPEALHQLCDALNASKLVSASMVYCRSNGRRVIMAPRAKRLSVYDRYDAPTSHDEDTFATNSQTTLFIWPECWTDEMLHYLSSSVTPSPCAIWWLSVNNNTGRFQEWDRTDILHLYQSEYAKEYVVQHHGPTHVYAMTECISDPPMPDGTERRTIDVLYNPVKGIHYTDEIIKRSGSAFQIRPIGGGPDGRVRISPQQVRELLMQAKIYIDFGPHPGMDRLPREAALAGCLVVTNMEGSAGNNQDLPLPVKYKRKKFDVEDIHQLLKDLVENLDDRSKEQDEYRTWIHGQKKLMNDCVSNFLDVIVTSKQTQNK